MTLTATDLQIVTLKHRLQVAREQLIKLRSVAQLVGDDDLVSDTNKVIDGAWHTLNFEMPELPSDLENRLEHQNPYKHGCNPALPMQETSLDRLAMMFSDVADKWIASDCSPLAISALQFAIGAVRDEQFRQDSPVVDAELHQMIGALRDRADDKLCLDAADTIAELFTGDRGASIQAAFDADNGGRP